MVLTPEERISRLQQQVDDLIARADASNHRADASDDRADLSDVRADDFEKRLDVDEAMLAELYSEGVLSRNYADQLETALRSSRMIGCAIGMIVASRGLTQDEAFTVLKRASQASNRKLRDVAAEIVATGTGKVDA